MVGYSRPKSGLALHGQREIRVPGIVCEHESRLLRIAVTALRIQP